MLHLDTMTNLNAIFKSIAVFGVWAYTILLLIHHCLSIGQSFSFKFFFIYIRDRTT